MSDSLLISLVGGRFDDHSVYDPKITMHEEDRIAIVDGDQVEYYVINCHGQGVPTNVRSKVYGDTWTIYPEDLRK